MGDTNARIGSGRPSRRVFLKATVAGLAAISGRSWAGGLPETAGTPGEYELTIPHDGLDRRFILHVPAAMDSGKPLPMVVALHPLAYSARMMAEFCDLSATADQHGFVLVYPEGTGTGSFRSWNAGGVGNPKIDDVGFIHRILDLALDGLPIDPRRVYAAGLSNGGMMCYRLASESSDRFAAVASVAGTMAFDRIDANRPISVMHFHGTADPIVPYSGLASRLPGLVRFLSVEETIRRWVEANNCSSPTERVEYPPVVQGGLPLARTRYGPNATGAEVVLYTIEGGGHTWPGATDTPRLLGPGAPHVQANDHIWSFFQRHALA